MKGIKHILIIVFVALVSFNVSEANSFVTDNEKEIEFKLYPNPVLGDEFTIESEIEIVEVKVLNLLGQQVFQNNYLEEKNVKIELETSEKGLYLVQIKTKDNRVTTKRILFK